MTGLAGSSGGFGRGRNSAVSTPRDQRQRLPKPRSARVFSMVAVGTITAAAAA